MANRNQVTADLRISAEAQLKNSQKFIAEIERMTKNFDFGEKMNSQLANAENQLKNYNKVLAKVQNKSIIGDKELKELVKAGQEVASIITKTQALYSSFNQTQWKQFSRQYIEQVKAQEKEIQKIKQDYANKTGNNFDKDLANLTQYEEKIKTIDKEIKNLNNNNNTKIADTIKQQNDYLQKQFDILKNIKTVELELENNKKSNLSKYSQKTGFSQEELQSKVKISRSTIANDVANQEYKQMVSTITQIEKERKAILESGKSEKNIQKELIALAQKYQIQNVKTTSEFEKQYKILLQQKNFYRLKDNRIQLATEKAITNEIERRKKILEVQERLNNRNNKDAKNILANNSFNSLDDLKNQKKAAQNALNSSNVIVTDSGASLSKQGESTIANQITASTNEQTAKLSQELSSIKSVIEQVKDFVTKITGEAGNNASDQDIEDLSRNIAFNGEDVRNVEDIAPAANRAADALQRAGQNSQYLGSTFEDIGARISTFFSLNYVFTQVTKKINEAVNSVREMDKDMTQIGLVLGKTSGGVWKSFNTYSQMAERLNTTTSEVTQSMKLFYQQGLNTSEVNKMVEASAIAAALGESSMAEASETLTSIINSYNLSANDAITVTDKISQIAIVSAADFGELSTAIEKVASSAASAGLDLDHMMGYLAKMIETTREAPTNIGTALKTIVANFTQFKEDPTQLDVEGSYINKVDKALKSVGISLTDATGEVKDLSIVLDELGGIWENLTRSQKSYLATQIAGTRQQSRFYALMNDYERTLELVAEGSNSAGKAEQQFALYSNSLEASANRLTNQWQIFFNNITQGNGIISKLTNSLTSLMKVVNAIKPIGTVLGFTSLIKSGRQAVITFNNLNKLAVDRIDRSKAFKQGFAQNKRDLDEGKITKQEKQNRDSNLRSNYMKKRAADVKTLTKSEAKYLNTVEKLNKGQNELNFTLRGSSKFIDKVNYSVGTAKNNLGKFWASVKLGVSQVKTALVSLGTQFAALAAITLAFKAISAITTTVKSALNINTEAYIENAEKAKENADNINSLTSEYEELSKKINKTAEEQERLKEIIEEVQKIDGQLGQQLKENANNYQLNIKAMKEYADLQEKIASQESIKAIKSEASVWNNLLMLLDGNTWTSWFGSENDKQTLVNEQQTNYRELTSARAAENNLTEAQTSMLNRYVETLIDKAEGEDWGSLNYKYNTNNFDEDITSFISDLQKLDSQQQETYTSFLGNINDSSFKWTDLTQQLAQLDLPQEIISSLNKQLLGIFDAMKAQINANNFIKEEDKEKAFYTALDTLSLKDAQNLINPDTSTMSKEEQVSYNRDVAQLLLDATLLKEYSEAQEKGTGAVKEFALKLSKTGKYSDIFIDSLYSMSEALDTDAFEKAITNLLKIGDLSSEDVAKGTASQFDILNELAKGNLQMQDLIITNLGTLSVGTSKIVAEQEKNINAIFDALQGEIDKRKAAVDNITDESKNSNLKNTKDTLDNINLARKIKDITSYYGNAEDYGGISGNIDLNNRKRTDLGNGQFGTENSITVTMDIGNGLGEMQYIVPTIIDGIQKSEEEAIEYFKQTGEYIAAFTTDVSTEAAETYANAIHQRQEEYYQDNNKTNLQRNLDSYYGATYEGGYSEDQIYTHGAFNFDASKFDIKKLQQIIDANQPGKWGRNESTLDAARSAYAQKTISNDSLGIRDTSNMTTGQKIDYIQQQNQLLEEQKAKIDGLDKNSQEYYNTTYSIHTIQKDLKNVLSEDETLIKNNAKSESELADEAKEVEKSYNGQVKAAEEVKTELNEQLTAQEKALEKVKKKLSENLNYQKGFAGFFDGLNIDNTLMQSLEGVKTAYQQLNETITDTDQLQQTLASNPALIQALDVTSEGLTWNKQKLEELGIAAIDESYNYIESRINDMQATKVTLEEQKDDIDKWSGYAVTQVAAVISGNNSLVNSQQENAKNEATNLGISEQTWINWSDSVCDAIINAGNAYSAFLNAQKNETEFTYDKKSLSKKVGSGGGGKGAADITTKKDDIKNTLKATGYTADKKGAIENINKQIELLRGIQNGLKYKKTNIGKYLGGGLYGDDKSGSKNKFDPLIEKLEHFYNYLRKIEKLEAKINRLREERNLIDTSKNYYINNLIEENELLSEQEKLYNSYIADQGDYLAELRSGLSKKFSKWVTFDNEGVVQIKQTEFNINSEKEQEEYEAFSELLTAYQDEYNTREENITKLTQAQIQQVENIAAAYEKVLARVTDVNDAIQKSIDLLEHDVTMSFSNIAKFDIFDEQAEKAVKGIREMFGFVNEYQAQIDKINKQISEGALKEFFRWDEDLGYYRSNDLLLEDKDMQKKYEKMGYSWSEIHTYVKQTAKASEQLKQSWEESTDKANSFAETLKSLLENSISTFTNLVSSSGDELNKIFDTFDRKMNNIDNESNLFGVASENLEDKYVTLVTATATLKQTIGLLNDKKVAILDTIKEQYSEFVDEINGYTVINKQAIEESDKLTDGQKAQLLSWYEAFNAYDELVEASEDRLVDYFNQILEMENEKRDAIINLKQSVHDELIARDQEEIDDLREKYDKMSQLDNEYYNKLADKVNRARQLREDRQADSAIPQTQAQIAVLKTDNSGTRNSEILNLQKQLNEQLQSQADRDVDRELERIQREQQEREEDRQLTIAAMENVLTFKDENNWYWQEAQRIWAEGPESVTGFLRTSNEYMNISDEQRAQLFEELSNSVNTAFATLQTAAGITSAISDGIVKDKSDEEQAKLDNVNNNLGFIQSQLGQEGLAGKIDWANAENAKHLLEIQTNADGNALKITTKLEDLYKEKIGPTAENLQNTVVQYLGKESDIWRKLGMLDATTGQVNTSVESGFTQLTDAVNKAITWISSDMDEAWSEYKTKAIEVFNYLSKEYGKQNAQTPDKNDVKLPDVEKEPTKNEPPKPTTPVKTDNSSGGTSKKTLKVGGGATAKTGAKIYSNYSGGSGAGQYYSKDPNYKVLQLRGNRALVRWHKLSSGYTGWFNKTDLTPYRKGGYVNYTGIAAVHGSKTSPEAFLSAKQTKLFEVLRDSLVATTNKGYTKEEKEVTNTGYNIDNINIEVKELADVDSVEKMTRKVKEEIYKDATGRNNMAVRRR